MSGHATDVQLSNWIDDFGGAQQNSVTFKHLRDCAECRNAADRLRAVRDGAVDLRRAVAPSSMISAPLDVRRGFRAFELSVRRRALLALRLPFGLAAAGLILAGGFAGWKVKSRMISTGILPSVAVQETNSAVQPTRPMSQAASTELLAAQAGFDEMSRHYAGREALLIAQISSGVSRQRDLIAATADSLAHLQVLIQAEQARPVRGGADSTVRRLRLQELYEVRILTLEDLKIRAGPP